MAALNLMPSLSRHSHIPVVDLGTKPPESIYGQFKKFKKPYTPINCFLAWLEKVCPSETAQFLAAQRRVLKIEASTYDIPAWFESASKFKQNIAYISEVRAGDQKIQAVKKSVFSSLEFTNASIELAQCLDGMKIIQLGPYSPIASGASCALRLVLKVNDVQQNYAKLKLPIRGQSAFGPSIAAEKGQVSARLKALEFLRSLLGLYTIILSSLALLSLLSVSPTWLLCVSTLSVLLAALCELNS